MEALWNLENKWNLSTKEAVLVLASTAFLLVCLCIVIILKRRASASASARKRQLVLSRQESDTGSGGVKQTFLGSAMWSKASKWKESPTPLLREKGEEEEAGWGSHNSDSPVWQRPILMGEKCEFPKFSGVILYDERGRPVFDYEQGTEPQQVIKSTPDRTTLRDLL